MLSAGVTINSWTILCKAGPGFRGWLCRCVCGLEKHVQAHDLLQGKSKSCRDCAQEAKRGKPRFSIRRHGLSNSPTMQSWTDMKRRCLNPARRGYENYGGRGITVHPQWVLGEGGLSGFEVFLRDLGERPGLDYQLDRLDNNGPYSPDNCRWVQREVQNYNKRNTFLLNFKGSEMTLLEAEKVAGVGRALIYHRIVIHGWAAERAVTQPPRLTKRS